MTSVVSMMPPPPTNPEREQKIIVRRVGPSAGVVLTLVFTGLKLTNNIDWPWLWVASPLWISAVLAYFSKK
jgi:hypothetical protein